MNYTLAREIYSRTAWAVDGETFATYVNLIKDFRNGVVLQPSEKLNNSFILDLKSRTKTVSSKWQAQDNRSEDQLVYLINLDGPITRTGGDSTYGTKQLSDNIKYFESLPNVIGGIILADSGGGSTTAVEIMDSAVKNAKKPIVSFIEQGALVASACYGCVSGSSYIMSDGKNNKVGSLGTMADFEAIPNKNVDQNGVKTIRVYATKSTAKNKWYEEAVNNDNFEPLINEILNPENEIFLNRIKSNRPQILESQLDGSVYKSGDVIGTLIDGIGTFEDAINKVIELSSNQKTNANNNKNKSNIKNGLKMDLKTLKSDHPAVYQEIFNLGKAEGVSAGISAEADRTGAWLAHASTDLDAVKAGIAGGGKITATARENFLVKANTSKKIEDIKSDSAEEIEVDESKGKTEPTEAETFYADVLKGL